MVWWMSRTNTEVTAIKDSLNRHIEEDERMREQIQSLEVNEANVAGTLSNFGLQLEYIRKSLDERDEGHGELLQLKLDKQSSDLINKFRDMLHATKKEIGDETAKATAAQIREYMRDRPRRED